MITFGEAKLQIKERERMYNPKADDMTLRDYFAARAMQAMMSSPEFMVVVTGNQALGENVRERIANLSYQYSDAMLKARDA
jgi:hypothetical protein